MTSYDDYFLGNFETGEIWSRDEFYKFKFDGYIVSNFMGILSLLNCLHKENKMLKQDKTRLINHLKRESVLWRDESYLNELILDNERLDGDVE